jgi:hypothetical protein
MLTLYGVLALTLMMAMYALERRSAWNPSGRRPGHHRLEPDPSDGRARMVRLTARGRRLHRAAVDVHAADG